jgi:membrane protein DedA with SNARE-associated domain
LDIGIKAGDLQDIHLREVLADDRAKPANSTFPNAERTAHGQSGRSICHSGEMRLSVTLKAMLVAGITLRLHHHFHGPPLDYSALALAAFASWVGVPGPGEPVLIAAGVLAAKHKLYIGEVLIVAFVAATAGGIVGWVIGIKAGRALVLRPGPLLGMRRRAMARGEEVFARYPAIAVLMTTSWIAGLHHVRTSVYLLWNAVGAALWAAGIGLGAYFAGPAVVDVVDDAGLIPVIGVGALVAIAVGLEWHRRRRKADREAEAEATAEATAEPR